ncbi:hypothetical protein ACWDLG_09620 [Nonomuraea sp. NPDC003727]
MSLSDVVRNIAKTVTNREELKEKAKELPLFVIQTTLSAAGQALLLADRVKNAVKGLGSNKEDDESERSPVADQPASGVEDEEKPARREPVIFAPRKEKAAERPEPVIFTPAKEESANGTAVKTAEPTAKPAEPEPAARTAEPQAASATTTEQAAPAVAEQPVTEQPTARQPVAEPVATAVAEPDTAEPKAAKPDTAKPEAAKPAAKPEAAKSDTAEPEAAKPAAKPEAAKSDTAEPEAAAPAVQPVSVEEADGELAKAAAATTATVEASVPVEPLAGYADLSVASLRARMRGKSVTQIEELLAYEKATTARPDVVRMYENRLTKLQAAE